MLKGKVIGFVVSTAKYKGLTGIKLMVIQLEDNKNPGKIVIAADAIGVSGEGDNVYIVNSREAGMPFNKMIPIDASIVGIIDEYNVNLKTGGDKND